MILILLCCLALAMLAFYNDLEELSKPSETSAPAGSSDIADITSSPESEIQTEETTEAETAVDGEASESQMTEAETATEAVTDEASAPVDTPVILDNVPDPYRSVLNNEKSFVVAQAGSTAEILLDEYHFPYSFTPITQTNVEYSVLDMDGDGESEVVLTGAYGDMLVLHNVGGTVYGFDFIFRNMYYIKTDGTFSWNDMGQNGLIYGISKLGFAGSEYRWNELCHVEDDGTDNFLYFIGDRSVTEAEYEAFESTLAQKETAWYTLERYPSVNIGG